MYKRTVATLIMLLGSCCWSFGQQAASSQTPESHKYRTICTVAGGGGGYVLGVFVGIAAFDDATYATRKVWTTALATAAAGAVGGYFLGRSLDKRKSAPRAAAADRLEQARLKSMYEMQGLARPDYTHLNSAR